MGLLEKYNNSVPARRESEQEPYEPGESFEDRSTRGRSPDEVIGERQTETPSQTVPEEEDVSIPAAGKTTITVDGRTYNLNEQQQKQLAEFGVRAFQQQVQAAAQQQAALQQQQAAPPVITNEAIARVYDEISRSIINDLVGKRLLDGDLPELYERSLLTMTGQVRFAFDKIYENEFKQNRIEAALVNALQRLEGTISWLNQFKATIEGEQPETRRGRDKQFLPSTKGGVALLNRMVASSGKIRR